MGKNLKDLVLKGVMEGSNRSLIGTNGDQDSRRCQGFPSFHGKGKVFRQDKTSKPGGADQRSALWLSTARVT